MKGHFWNLKEKYKESKSINEKEEYSFVETSESENQSKIGTQPSRETIVPIEDVRAESESEGFFRIENQREIEKEPTDRLDVQIDLIETIGGENFDVIHKSQNEKQAPSSGEIAFAVFMLIVLIVSFWLGLAGLIATLFLWIFSTVIPWIFYTSLIMVVVPLIVFGIILML